MIYLGYALSELRRRKARTLVTAFGLAVGVGFVIAVNALSTGLDDAQAEVLAPLTGIGTDLSVTRPIAISTSRPGGFLRLSAREREQLERENGSARIGLRNVGEPGTKFSRDSFLSMSQLSFPASQVARIEALDGVRAAAGGLRLSALHVEGTVPEEPPQPGVFDARPAGPGGPENIDVSSVTVAGVDQASPQLGAITAGQIVAGRYFSSGSRWEAVLDVAYARRRNLAVGDTTELGGKTYRVVGLAETPLGGQSSDVYVKLAQLQRLSGRKGRVNTVYVRATSADRVGAVSDAIAASFEGASVTTAEDLAERVSGSLVDAGNLSARLGLALELVALLAAVLIASLLTLASVTKRVRELGTLKAIGWPQRLVVRQVAGEALLQGLLGGALGIAIGVAGAAAIEAFAPSLEATVASGTQSALPGPFGQGAVTTTVSTTVPYGAPVSAGLVAAAVALAVAGGLVSGAVGGLRASRLRPADALRHVD